MGADTGGLVVAATDAGGLTWTAPATWKAKPGSAMRKGSYTIGTEGGPAADLAITAFPGDVGGDLANVNRWLGQLGRPPIAAAELAGVLTPLAGAGVAMQVVDLAGGTAGGQYTGADLSAKLTGTALRAALGIGEYASDAAAGTGGVSTGELYYNTADSAYVLKS